MSTKQFIETPQRDSFNYENRRSVLIEKRTHFLITINADGKCGWWYGGFTNENRMGIFFVRNGTQNDLKLRKGYTDHLTKYGFYIITEGKFNGNCVSKAHAVKI